VRLLRLVSETYYKAYVANSVRHNHGQTAHKAVVVGPQPYYLGSDFPASMGGEKSAEITWNSLGIQEEITGEHWRIKLLLVLRVPLRNPVRLS